MSYLQLKTYKKQRPGAGASLRPENSFLFLFLYCGYYNSFIFPFLKMNRDGCNTKLKPLLLCKIFVVFFFFESRENIKCFKKGFSH